MIYNAPDTYTGQLASVPHPTCQLHPRFEATKCLPQHDISDHYPKECQQNIDFISDSRQYSNEAKEAHVPPGARTPHKAAVHPQDSAQPLYPTPTDINGVSGSQRGKSSIVREIVSGLPSNAAQAQAQTTSIHADTNLNLATHESRSDEINEEITEDIKHSEGATQNASGSRRGPSNPLHQSSLPVADEAGLGFFQAGLYYPVASLVGRFAETVRRYWYIPRDQNSQRPLLHSLHGYNPTFSAFIISEKMPNETSRGHVRFVGFSQDVNLEAEITKVYDDETRLFQILSEPTIPITILFDICRQGQRPSATPPSGISLFWTCSIGETAGACIISDCNAPNSCFLIALMISACTPNLQHTSETLGKMIQERLDQVMGYLEEHYSMRHPTGKCAKCSNAPKPCDKPTQQNVDWGETKDMDGLLELAKILSGSDIANDVYRWFMEDDIFLRVNKLQDPRELCPISPEHGGSKLGLSLAVVAAPSPPPDLEPLPEGRGKHERGASGPVRAGSALGQEWGLALK
ncbi:hypothetical protein B0J17DRAFT_646880 [Rhizoctonia solani]|nr:hypothetical protein B0J17DRAFT_646880 [Rhizoctonia solani]